MSPVHKDSLDGVALNSLFCSHIAVPDTETILCLSTSLYSRGTSGSACTVAALPSRLSAAASNGEVFTSTLWACRS